MLRSRFDVLFEASPIGTMLASLDGQVIAANEAAAKLTGVPVAELVGKHSEDLSHPADVDPTRALIRELLASTRDAFRVDKRYLTPSGEVLWVQLDARLLPADDEHPAMILAHLQDVTDRYAREARLINLARTDPLTGLLNRRGLEEGLADELARRERYGTPFAILLLDVDRFKRINDTHGHDVGDRVLISVAKVLRSRLRDLDLAGRLGGDEFVAVLLGARRDDAAAVAADLSGRALTISGLPGTVHLSAGFALAVPGDSALELLSRADRAMYRCKRDGSRRDGTAPIAVS